MTRWSGSPARGRPQPHPPGHELLAVVHFWRRRLDELAVKQP